MNVGDKNDNKVKNWPGVNYASVDFGMVSSVKVTTTRVVQPIFKKGRFGYIALKDILDIGDVIKVGNFELLYRCLNQEKPKSGGGYLHKIKRVDNNSITEHDLSSIHKGDKVHITNRRSFDQMFLQATKPYRP